MGNKRKRDGCCCLFLLVILFPFLVVFGIPILVFLIVMGLVAYPFAALGAYLFHDLL